MKTGSHGSFYCQNPKVDDTIKIETGRNQFNVIANQDHNVWVIQ